MKLIRFQKILFKISLRRHPATFYCVIVLIKNIKLQIKFFLMIKYLKRCLTLIQAKNKFYL
jgi:hypothetical protein